MRFPLTSYGVKKVKVVTRAVGPEGIDAVGLEAQVVEDYEYNGFNQLLSVTPSDGGPSTAFGYDGNGNQTSRTDASGVTQYVYGADDRLVGVALPGGGGSAYEYDANGLRVKKADSAGTTRYLLDGLSVVGQYGADGARQAFYVQSLARIDEVLSVVNGQGKHWYQADALGSVYTLTTAAGEVRARGGYDVFGAPVAESGAAVGQPFGFTGREHDLDAALVYARARYMNPALGAWTQPDRLGMVDGPNVYGYVGSNPVLRVDPSGNFFIVPALIGGLIGGLMATLVGVISGQHGMELLQSFGQGVAIGMLSAIVPGMGAVSHELAAALSGAMVSAFANLFGQFIDIFSGKKTWSDFSVGQFLTALAIGAAAGLVGGTFSPGSKLWYWVMDYQVPMLRDLWQATMAAAMLSGFIGGAGDVVSAIIRRQLMVEQALADDRTLDIENQLCVPWSGR